MITISKLRPDEDGRFFAMWIKYCDLSFFIVNCKNKYTCACHGKR